MKISTDEAVYLEEATQLQTPSLRGIQKMYLGGGGGGGAGLAYTNVGACSPGNFLRDGCSETHSSAF